MPKISIIVPCYNEQEALPYFYNEITSVFETMENYERELLFINDGSRDNTLRILKELAAKDDTVTYISFSRNFGKEAAMYAGFCNAGGDYVAVMDADMQDPPALLPQMISVLEKKDYDSVATRRQDRAGEPPIRSWFARRFYQIINKISDADIVDGARDFRLMKRQMVDAIVAMCESSRFSKGIFGWIGFKTYWLPYENIQRVAGETKWNFWKLLKYSIDGIVNFSSALLDIPVWLGAIMSILSFPTLLFLVIGNIIRGIAVASGSVILCTIVLLAGIQLICLGIMGQYLGKTYQESKKRPTTLYPKPITNQFNTSDKGNTTYANRIYQNIFARTGQRYGVQTLWSQRQTGAVHSLSGRQIFRF